MSSETVETEAEEQLMEQSDRYKALGLQSKYLLGTGVYLTCFPPTEPTLQYFVFSRLSLNCPLAPTPPTATESASSSSTMPVMQAIYTSDT